MTMRALLLKVDNNIATSLNEIPIHQSILFSQEYRPSPGRKLGKLGRYLVWARSIRSAQGAGKRTSYKVLTVVVSYLFPLLYNCIEREPPF